MVNIIGGVSAAGYILFSFIYSRKWMTKSIVFVSIYLIGLTFVTTMDVVLPIYFLAVIVPLLPYLRHISKSTGLVCAYYLIYLIYGMVFQNTVSSITTFIARYWQFIVFFLVWDSVAMMDEKLSLRLLWFALAIETTLSLYLMFSNEYVGANGLVRLVAGHQPITGNIAIIMLPVSIYLYYANKGTSRIETMVIVIDILFFAWTILSGTRGYMLIYGLTLPFLILDFFMYGRTNRRGRVVLLIVVILLLVLIIISVPGLLDMAASVMRADESTGIRPVEDAITRRFLLHAPIGVKLFGIGLGGTPGHYKAFVDAVYSVRGGRRSMLSASGGLFHNMYDSILISTGIIGIFIILYMNVKIWKITTRACGRRTKLGLILHIYQLGFLIMCFFRWSSSCGITEMVALSLILKRVVADREKRQEELAFA